MDMSGIADATDELIKSLALLIEIAHYCIVIYGVRSDWDCKKARQQPLGTWLMSVACCFGGGMLVSISVGKPALTPLANTDSVILMTIVWWHVFYFPQDVFYSFLCWKPALFVIAVLKEMIRTRKVIKGVKLGRGAFLDSLLICTFLGMLGACGGGFVKNSAIFIRNKWDHQSVKNVFFAPATKLSLLFSFLYNLQLRGDISIGFNTVVLMQFLTMSIFVAGSKVGMNVDPFRPIEKIITSLTVDYTAFGADMEDVGEEKEKEKGKKATEKKKETNSHKKKD